MSDIESMTAEQLDVLKEIGNILAGSYLTALADFTGQALQPSVPILASDMAGAILAEGLMALSDTSDYTIIIETIIENESNNQQQITGHFLLLPDPDSFPKLFNQLGVTDQ